MLNNFAVDFNKHEKIIIYNKTVFFLTHDTVYVLHASDRPKSTTSTVYMGVFHTCSGRQISNIRRFVGKKIVEQSDEVGASPLGTAPATSSFST